MPADALTLSAAAALFLEHKRRTRAWSDKTFARARFDLALFAVPAHAPLQAVDADALLAFLGRIADLAVASQRSRWHLVAECMRWCARRRLLQRSPTEDVDRAELPWHGRRARRLMGRGKPQLRNQGEVLAYLRTAGELPDAAERVAAVLPLVCGLRSGELRHLRVADVDFALGRIWIRGDDDGPGDGWNVKTASSRRTVGLPGWLRADLEALCAEQEPSAYLFRSARSRGGPFMYQWLGKLVARVCTQAGTRIVCPHGLRNTFASVMAALADATAADVARLVGHGDTGRTARQHYIGEAEHTSALRLDLEGRGAVPASEDNGPDEGQE